MRNRSNKPTVLFIFRKPQSSGNYSVESLFFEVFKHVAKKTDCKKLTLKFHSRGIIKRLLIVLESFMQREATNFITGDVSFITPFLYKRKSILVILDCGFLYDTRGFRRWLESLLWFKYPVSRCDAVVAISDATKTDLMKVTNCNPSKISVIPCFISSIFKRIDKEFNETCPVLLQVGQASNKNLKRIIYALTGLSVKLTIIGNISEQNTLLLNSLNISYETRVNLTDEQVFQEYVDSDALIFPSTYEGFGLPIIEAQTVGRAVITSNVTSMPWVAGDGACFVDPFSHESIRAGVIKVLEDSSFRQRIIKKGFENVKRFERQKIMNMYSNLIAEISDEDFLA